jgi:hypothetical protein
MSALDQPLLIANSNYHVGHEITVRVAEAMGFFREEGLASYVYRNGGVIPGPFESRGLALAIKEQGLDVVTAVNAESAVFQCSKGAELRIVGGWRYESTPDLKWYAAKHITELRQLRGAKIGVREMGSLTHISMSNALRTAGLDPERDVEWLLHPAFAYRNNPAHLDMLRSGKVDVMTSAPPLSDRLDAEGYPVILDPKRSFPRGRPGKVIVATARTIEHRGKELRAFLRGIIRAFWHKRDVANFESIRKLESELRRASHNEDERGMAIVTGPEKIEGWPLPIDGGVPRETLEAVIGEMAAAGEIDNAIPVDNVLVDGPVTEAFREVSGRPELGQALDRARAAAKKYGF